MAENHDYGDVLIILTPTNIPEKKMKQKPKHDAGTQLGLRSVIGES